MENELNLNRRITELKHAIEQLRDSKDWQTIINIVLFVLIFIILYK